MRHKYQYFVEKKDYNDDMVCIFVWGIIVGIIFAGILLIL